MEMGDALLWARLSINNGPRVQENGAFAWEIIPFSAKVHIGLATMAQNAIDLK